MARLGRLNDELKTRGGELNALSVRLVLNLARLLHYEGRLEGLFSTDAALLPQTPTREDYEDVLSKRRTLEAVTGIGSSLYARDPEEYVKRQRTWRRSWPTQAGLFSRWWLRLSAIALAHDTIADAERIRTHIEWYLVLHAQLQPSASSTTSLFDLYKRAVRGEAVAGNRLPHIEDLIAIKFDDLPTRLDVDAVNGTGARTIAQIMGAMDEAAAAQAVAAADAAADARRTRRRARGRRRRAGRRRRLAHCRSQRKEGDAQRVVTF